MKKELYQQNESTLKSARNQSRTVIRFLAAVNILLILIIAFNYNREKIVLVPQVSPEYKMFVTNSQASDSYLNVLSRNVLDLLLNITPENVAAQQSALLQMVNPSYRATLKSKLDVISDNLKENNLSSNFYLDNVRVIQGQNIVIVKGTLIQYINNDSASTAEQMYRIKFSVKNYNVELTDISLTDSSDPLLKTQ
jgi:type IV conjugative transfer system protein TraE